MLRYGDNGDGNCGDEMMTLEKQHRQEDNGNGNGSEREDHKETTSNDKQVMAYKRGQKEVTINRGWQR